MGDATQRTVVPLLSSYRHSLARRRLLETATGGLKLRTSHCRLNLLQFALYFFPLALALPFIVLDALEVWKVHYLAAVYAFIYTVAVFSVRTGVYCSLKNSQRRQQEREVGDDNDDDETDMASCFSYNSLFFIFSSKNLVSLIIHCLIVCLIFSFTASLVLLPRVLSDHLPLSGVVVVGTIGWLVICSSHYSLSISQPHEVAVYRPTDLLGLGALTRPVYLISSASAIIAIRLAVRDVSTVDLSVQLLYTTVCLLPLGWLLGCLPPLDSLLPWAMEQLLTRIMGGSHMTTDLRLLVAFLLSLVSTVIVGVIAHYSSYTTALLLASASGYLLSHDLSSLLSTISTLIRFIFRQKRNSSNSQWKAHTRHAAISCLRGIVLIVISLLLVYFSSTARENSRAVAGRVLGSCVVALCLILSISGASQRIYILGLFRNPLHPWKSSDDIQKYKLWRKRLSYCSFLPQLALTYLSPLVMLSFLSVKADGVSPNQWLRALGAARKFRRLWQNTGTAQIEVSIVFLLLLALPEDSWWVELGVELQTLLVGIGLEMCQNFFQSLWFGFKLFIKFLTKDGKKIQRWVYITIAVGSPLLFLCLITASLASSLVSAPLLPLFTLPLFLVSFPRPLRFWPSLTHYGSSYTSSRDSVYYQHDNPNLSQALLNAFSSGSLSGQPGDFYLLRHQDRTLIASVLECGHRFLTINIRGLEIEETSCHTAEAAKIDDIFSEAYTPKCLSFWFNHHLLNTMKPVDSAVIRTYSSSRISLTGIIDQPQALQRFSDNLLRCVVWVLHYYVSQQRSSGGFMEGTIGEELVRERNRVKWRRGNKVVPVADNEMTAPPLERGHHESRRVEVEEREDTLSWSVNTAPTRDQGTSMFGLIPVDIPLTTRTQDSVHQSTVREDSVPQDCSLFPAEWLDFPLTLRQLDTLLSLFPTPWLEFISSSQPSLLRDTLSLQTFKRLCLMCFSIADVPRSSRGMAKTRPHHIHSSFCGEFPYSRNRNWLTQRPVLHQLTLQAHRYAVRLLCDEAAVGEAEDSAELSDYLLSYQSHYHIGREGESDWNRAILDQKPNLFSVGKSQENNTYVALVLTLQEECVHIGKLDSVAVRGVWADLALELLYLTNDDEERHSIQAHPSLLRNLTIQAADPPLGYSIFSSGLTRCPPIT